MEGIPGYSYQEEQEAINAAMPRFAAMVEAMWEDYSIDTIAERLSRRYRCEVTPRMVWNARPRVDTPPDLGDK